MLVFGQPERRQLRRTVAIITFFSIISILVNYLYIRALGVIAPADVTAIFSSSNAFVYVFSFIWLQEKFSFVRVSSHFCERKGMVEGKGREEWKGRKGNGRKGNGRKGNGRKGKEERKDQYNIFITFFLDICCCFFYHWHYLNLLRRRIWWF